MRATLTSISPLGPDCGAYTSASFPVFLVSLCQLRSISKLEIVGVCFVRREKGVVGRERNLLVFVWELVIDVLNLRDKFQDGFAHLVHGVLY